VKRAGDWLLGVPLALAGVAAAHALANALFGSPDARGELFASNASGAVLPLVAAVAIAAIVLGLAMRVASGPKRSVSALAGLFALLPPLAFVLLELLEGLVDRGAVPFGELAEPTFIAGLALQLPFAVAAYALARLLLRAGDELRMLLVPERESLPVPLLALPVPSGDGRLRSFAHWSRERGRAPPLGLTVPG
jgi:hypothetical protein